jgi:hypothetical protein
MDLTQRAIRHFLDFLEDDYTELWVLSSFVRSQAPDLTTEQLVEQVKHVLTRLIDDHKLYVVDSETEERREMTSEEIMAEVEGVFSATNGNPDIGDGIWFGIDVSIESVSGGAIDVT